MSSADQRRSIRLPVSLEQASAVLRIGRRSTAGTMVNESAGGFAVRVAGDSAITVRQVLLLGVSSGWSRARVTYAQRDENGLVLGLQRLSDVQPEFEDSSGSGLWIFDRLRMRRPVSDWSWYLGGVLVVCGVTLAATIWQVVSASDPSNVVLKANDHGGLHRAVPGGAPTTIRTGNHSSATAESNALTERVGGSLRAVESWLAGRARDAGKWLSGVRGAATAFPSSASESTHQVENWSRQVRQSWDQWQDEVVLLLPQVADELQLTSDQRTRIEAIVHDSRQTVQQVYRNAQDKSSPEVWREIERVRKEAGELALAQLTPQQQEQLAALRAT
jgi:hypothetical protein